MPTISDSFGPVFQYNPEITNINIDNQLAGVLSQFSTDYILHVVDTSLENRYRVLDLPMPNIVASYELTFKQLTNGFSSYTATIATERERVYRDIIQRICSFYNLDFAGMDDTDWYTAAFWLYKFFVSEFTANMTAFYSRYMIKERYQLDSAMGLSDLRKDNDVIFSYSKRLFADPVLAAVHANLGYVLESMQTFPVNIGMILNYVYEPNIASYINSIIDDRGDFFREQYESFVLNPRNSADMITNIKMSIQQLGAMIPPIAQETLTPSEDNSNAK